jgi:FkbM family methyltransferase
MNPGLKNFLYKFLIFNYRMVISLQLRLERVKLLFHKKAQEFGGFNRLRVGNETISWPELLSVNARIVEVGAFDGRDTINFARDFPEGNVIAFEPDIDLFVEARTNLKLFKNTCIFPFAVSDKSEVARFYRSFGASRASGSLRIPTAHQRIYPDVEFELTQENSVITVDLNTFLQGKLNQIDLLWIDAQGHELSVLKGASAFLDKVAYIFCEVSNISLYENSATFTEIALYLKTYNLDLMAADIDFDFLDGTGNALFKRRNLD